MTTVDEVSKELVEEIDKILIEVASRDLIEAAYIRDSMLDMRLKLTSYRHQ